ATDGARYAIAVGIKKRDPGPVMQDFIDDIKPAVKACGLTFPAMEAIGIVAPAGGLDLSLDRVDESKAKGYRAEPAGGGCRERMGESSAAAPVKARTVLRQERPAAPARLRGWASSRPPRKPPPRPPRCAAMSMPLTRRPIITLSPMKRSPLRWSRWS